jgi:hypothetical protein
MANKEITKLAKEVLYYINQPCVTWVNRYPLVVGEECIYTAIVNVGKKRGGEGVYPLVDAIEKALGVSCLVTWNDKSYRMREEIIAVLEEIIAQRDKR